jgi:endonuclease/exonuclease/phosphatase (EEP) superfamily protein YafD
VAVHLRHIPKARNEQGFVQTGGGSMAGTLFREAVFPTVRSRAAHSITEWLSTWPVRRAIVAGDFNTVPFTRTIRRMNRRYEEALCGTGGYLSGTYWKVEGSILPRVDFIFHSEELDRRRAFVIEEKAGDHYPVYAEFNLSGGE